MKRLRKKGRNKIDFLDAIVSVIQTSGNEEANKI